MRKALLFSIRVTVMLFACAVPVHSPAGDWPIYKGNIYFTGNNDEIIVKNNNLKWLYQAGDRVFNPVVSDERVYFVDLKSDVYCLDEEYGTLLWKVDMKKISSQFKAFSRAAGKIKYPLVTGGTLILSDPVALYAFDKTTGTVLWARTGMREETVASPGLSGKTSIAMVDGIYADPIVSGDEVYYGTRNMFMAREVRNGHIKWDNRDVKTYSGFPSFYDAFIFTQSMDYSANRYTVHCLGARDGKALWSRDIEKPLQIFPPVVYGGRVYIPSGKTVYCLDLKTGEVLWSRAYRDFITSNLSFTDRAILFSIANSDIAVVDPEKGDTVREITVGPQSSPSFVTVRDQVYIAYTASETVRQKTLPFGRVRAVNFGDDSVLWEYKTPFPGAASQPVASRGILYFPAGNYLYAIGTEYYPRVVAGGDGYAVVPGTDVPGPGKLEKPPEVSGPERPKPEAPATRTMKVTVRGDDGGEITAQVEVRKREKGDTVYNKRTTVKGGGEIEVPAGDGVELLATAEGHVPRKEIIGEKDKDRTITLERLRKGRGYVIDNILFEFDKAYLKRESLDILDKLVRIMKGDPSLRVEVRGHTDSTGDSGYNRKLSERRADAVVEYMIKNGVSPERLRSTGFGETRPLASNDTAEGRGRNRRTEFFFLEQ